MPFSYASFTFQVEDNGGTANGGVNLDQTPNTITVNVTGVNDVPTLTGTKATLLAGTEDTNYTIRAADLLRGFSDVDGDTLSVSNLSASNGTLVNNNNGTWNFTPTANYNGSSDLTYNVIDGNGGSKAATQSFTIAPVNDAPTGTATADLATGSEDTNYIIRATDLLTGFSDVEGDTLSVAGLSTSNGMLVNNNNGTWSFNPNDNYKGNVNLSYNVIDGNGGSKEATQSFTLAAVNDAPTGTATADLAAGSEDTNYTIRATDLLTGFTDVDGDTLSVAGLSANNGTLVNNNNGTWSFNPNDNYNGSVNLSYNVTDGNGGSKAATQSFTLTAVNDTANISGDATASLIEDSATPTLTAGGTLSVSDVDAGEAKFSPTVTGTTGNLGSLDITEAGAYSYTVANSAVQSLGAGETKTNTFSVKSLDGTATKDIVVTLTGVNDAPTGTATANLAAGSEDTGYTIRATDLLTGISDVDGDTLSVSNLTATNGTLVNNNNGTWNFTPTANYNGSSNLSYNVTDGNGGSTSATQSFTIAPVNDAPTATNDLVSTSKGTGVTVELGNNVSDIEGLTGATLKTSNVVNGTVSLIDSDAQQITFKPNDTFVGTTSFNYTITDAGGLSSNTATVTVNVGDVISTGNQSQNIIGNEGNDYISAGNGKDILTGLGGADTLLGNNGVDTINGGEGDDIIWGGNGSDLLKGEGGRDKFVLAKGAGNDTISDFAAGTDLIGLSGGMSFSSVSFSGSNILLTSSNEILATLTGVNTSALGAANFVTI